MKVLETSVKNLCFPLMFRKQNKQESKRVYNCTLKKKLKLNFFINFRYLVTYICTVDLSKWFVIIVIVIFFGYVFLLVRFFIRARRRTNRKFQ